MAIRKSGVTLTLSGTAASGCVPMQSFTFTTSSIETGNIDLKEVRHMTEEKLKEHCPDVYQAVYDEGVMAGTAEQARLSLEIIQRLTAEKRGAESRADTFERELRFMKANSPAEHGVSLVDRAMKALPGETPASHLRLMAVCFAILAVVAAAILSPGTATGQTCEKWAARVVSAEGTVQVKKAGEARWAPVKLNGTYCPGDTIRALERSRAALALANHPVLRLDEGTAITLKGVKEEKTSVVELVKGAAYFFSRAPRNLEVNTAFVNAGVEGTEFYVRVGDDGTSLTIFEGKVLASNEAGSLAVTTGQSAVAVKGRVPELRVVVRPRDAVQWTLYYPPVLYYRAADFQGLPEAVQAMIRKSAESYVKGDFGGALESIAALPDDARDHRLFVYRASLLLAVGRVDAANRDIERALGIKPGDSDALALQSVIAVAQNEKDKARDLAERAVAADPKSAPALMALSYARQARFDLNGALESLQAAVQAQPDNALAWARLSEIWLAFGETGKALDAARKASELSPDLARTQSVLGFAYLTAINVPEAKKAFGRAIELDQGDPLPRLGLGLATIRKGDLGDGTREIEIAASLDPNNSLIRSYLGKAYYEEKKEKQASDQYTTAKEFDPLDPTPFFYDAILKQTTNRPVEALEDYEKAIELNDNRAVYRSSLLLDADLAARSAAIARIYNNLGFEQRALVEGWKSVNTDPADFSGHRFLSDTYAALPRHQVARVSELLQSQLLQPLNITPIQPRLAESNLLIISGGGPADLSLNEFNPLFNRNRIALQASGIAGENKTIGGEAIVSGVYDKFSFSAGASYYGTDGFRPNNDLNDNVYDVFLQVSLSPQTSVQAEYRNRNTRNGELQLRFFPDDFRPDLRQHNETNSVRLGFHHSFAPGSDLIGNFMYQDGSRSLHDTPDPTFFPLFDLKGDDKAYSAELQQQFQWKGFKLIVGGGYFDINSSDVVTTELNIPIDPELPPVSISDTSTVPRDVSHGDLYAYGYITALKNAVFTLGLSGDFLKRDLPGGGTDSKNQLNPKLGITWTPLQGTTLRAAAFRVLKRTLITDQTLEPTQVAGFNQFYDDVNATESWCYGVAVDQKFSRNFYAGAEFSWRDLTVPFNDLSGEVPTLAETDWSEQVGRAYLYWTPHKWFALTADYFYEKLKRDNPLDTGAAEVKTQRIPLGVNFFHPSGFSAMFRGSYVTQKGDFVRRTTGEVESGSSSFWLFDAAFSYRLPKRLGFLTFGGKNIFNKTFNYFDSDPNNPTIQPGRFLYMRASLSFDAL